jgi:hypothetical protein
MVIVALDMQLLTAQDQWCGACGNCPCGVSIFRVYESCISIIIITIIIQMF